jgi:hypothetical protein
VRVAKPRTRIVYFRVSEEEFGQLDQLRLTQGARSLSDLARSAMSQMLKDSNQPPQDDIAQVLRQLEDALSEVNRRLGELAPVPRRASVKAAGKR